MKYAHTKPIARLIFDIETIAADDAEAFLPEPKIAATVKDPDKIAAQRAEKLVDMLERAPLDPDLATVKLITMRITVEDKSRVLLVPAKKLSKPATAKLEALVPSGSLVVGDEKKIIEHFWGCLLMCDGRSIGYNTMGFDLPFLMRRSMALGIVPNIIPQMAKYRSEPTTDLMGLLFNWSWGENVKKLKWIAKRYDLEILCPEGDGKGVADMTDAEVIQYGLSDLHITAQLYKLMNGVYFDHMTSA